MKEIVLSNCEKNFILRAAAEYKRLDGRKPDEFRKLKVYFGTDYGLCYASLGETKVLAQVSCEIEEPKTSRPNEGLLFVNVELSPMAASHFEAGRNSELSVHINRLLDKCIKVSKAVDLESLCIVAEEKVWVLRVDINVLNHDGSLVDCASIAALAALGHFKRPDVTTDGQEIKVHDASERDPIPITLHHYPVCVSFALMNDGENVLADPTGIEERVSDASLVFGVNAYRELCALHLGGIAITKPTSILKYSSKAAKRAKAVVEIIKNALNADAEARISGNRVGFVECFNWDKSTSMTEDRLKVQLNKFTISGAPENDVSVQENSNHMEQDSSIVNLGDNCAELIPPQKRIIEEESGDERSGDAPPPSKVMRKETNKSSVEEWLPKTTENLNYGEGGPSKWDVDLQVKDTTVDSDSEKEIVVVPVEPKKIENIELSGDSEEEDVLVLEAGDIENPKRIQAKKNSSPTRQGNKAGQSSNRGNFQHSNNKNNNQRSNPNQGKRNRKKKKK